MMYKDGLLYQQGLAKPGNFYRFKHLIRNISFLPAAGVLQNKLNPHFPFL